MRERLIALLCEVECKGDDLREGGCGYRQGEKCNSIEKLDMCMLGCIADHLLANDVIVLPCKVGDKIYRLNALCSSVNEATVKAVYYTEDKKYYPKSHIIIQYDLHRGRTRVNFSEFGKTVFLTREEAEKALKGDEGK